MNAEEVDGLLKRLDRLSQRLGIEKPTIDSHPMNDIAGMLEAVLNRVELLEKQMAAVQQGCSYIEPITHDEERKP